LQLGGLLGVLHAHRFRVEYRAPLLPPNGVFRVVDLRTFAILLDLPSWLKPTCPRINDGRMPHHCSPQSLHLLRFFFFLAVTSTCLNNSQIEIPGACSWCMSSFFGARKHPEYLPSGSPPPGGSPGSPESRSRVCGGHGAALAWQAGSTHRAAGGGA
jgi:hypothetical protein